MKLEIDPDADAAYLSLKEIKAGEAVKTLSLNASFLVDFDKNDKALGIEILNISKNIPQGYLDTLKKKTTVENLSS